MHFQCVLTMLHDNKNLPLTTDFPGCIENQEVHSYTAKKVITEVLIQLVRSRTYLYSPADPAYRYHSTQQQEWQEIAQELYPEWQSFSRKQKEAKIK